uniref:Salviol synthase n=1 Tax=Salvia pomifera TaxID=396869 RepID=C71BE_SALPM|nr:RecName: Full=Salviol synthase; AltName: Full=Cytochrome P450 71BE52; Short=SpCYP71BE52 [Salvia pomifera]ALM25794.1 cytochrome P450 71BE52 [Salvia pomifera]
MEIHIPSLVLCISFFIFFKIVSKLKTKTSNRKHLPLPPGPWKLPLIGNLHNLVGALPHHTLRRLSRKFGPMMSLQLGELSAVIISSADAAKEIMKTHDLNFASRPQVAAADIIGYGSTNITFSPYGGHWRQLRKICTLELLSAKRVQSFRPLRERVFVDLCRRFADHGSSAVNFSEEFMSATYTLISRAVLGEEAEQHEGLLPNVKEMPELTAGFDISEVFPSVGLFKVMSRLRKRIVAVHKDTDRILDDVIHQHRAAKSEEHKDLLDVLLQLQEDGLELPLTDENIKSVLVDMLVAGSETSSTVIEWAMAEMLKNPRILEKAQEEVRRVFDKEGTVDESHIHELKYLKSVVKETLRVHPPAPLILPRICGETCEINGYEIPAETKIIVNAWAVNRDPKYWEDSDCFKPERFLDNLVDFRGNHFQYIPFGAGRRMCPGIGFGLANVELPLAMFMYHFDWELDGGMKPQDLDMEEKFGASAKKLKDLFLIPAIKRTLPTK